MKLFFLLLFLPLSLSHRPSPFTTTLIRNHVLDECTVANVLFLLGTMGKLRVTFGAPVRVGKEGTAGRVGVTCGFGFGFSSQGLGPGSGVGR